MRDRQRLPAKVGKACVDIVSAPAAKVLLATLTVLLVAAGCGGARERVDEPPPRLGLPKLEAGGGCPVSRHRPAEDVSPLGELVLFGDGPVYLATARPGGKRNAGYAMWHPDEGTIDYDAWPHPDGRAADQLSWAAKPGFGGRVLVRGRRLDGEGEMAFKTFEGDTARRSMTLGPDVGRSRFVDGWRTWTGYAYPPSSGCYAVQLDWPDGREVIVFEALRDG